MLEFFPMPIKGQFIFTFDLKENWFKFGSLIFFFYFKTNLVLKYFKNINSLLYLTLYYSLDFGETFSLCWSFLYH